jgi:hypothetical protein
MASVGTKKQKALWAIAFIFVLALVIAEWQLQFLRTAPPANRSALAPNPNLQLLLQPQKAPGFIHTVAEQQAGRSIPQWLLNRAMPYEMGVLFYEGESSDNIQVTAYSSMPHLAKPATRFLQGTPLSEIDSDIEWAQETVSLPVAGLVQAQGSVPADSETNEAVFYQWGSAKPLTSMSLTGDHFGEMVFDNRAGQAYLSLASFMTAHGLDFGENHDKILASFQFVISMRAHVNITANNEAKVFIGIEIQPENKNKLGVGALHGGLKEAFVELGKTLEAQHQIALTGDSDWNENVIEFNYTIENATQVAALLASGQLL